MYQIHVSQLFTRLFRIVSLLFMSSVSVAETKTYENTWYGGVSWLSFQHDLVNERVLKSQHDNFFFSRDIGGNEYGQRRIDFEDSQNGFRVYVGVSPNDSWDWEFGIVSFDDVTGDFTAGQISAPFSKSRLETIGSLKGWFLHVQTRFDLESLTYIKGLELVPKLGFWGWDSQIESEYFTDLNSTGEQRRVDNDRGYDEYYGIGLSYEIVKGFHIRADIDRYVFGSSEADVASVTFDFIVPRIPYVFF